MPERPDLDYVVPILDEQLRGATIESVEILKPVVLRVLMREPFEAAIVGARIERVARHGHFVELTLASPRGSLAMPVAPMLAGRFTLVNANGVKTGSAKAPGTKAPGTKAPGTRAGGAKDGGAKDGGAKTGGTKAIGKAPRDTALTWVLGDGRRLYYRDDVQMGKVFLVGESERAQVPGLVVDALDVLSSAFTFESFTTLAKKRRDQVKLFIMDKAVLDAFGNAYADEALWEARIHPKTFVRSLDDDALGRLHRALPKVLAEARDEIVRRAPPIDEKVRDFLKVRNRAGQPCPRCNTKIRKAGVRGFDAFFCPTCQPDARSSSIVDWGSLGKEGPRR